MPPSVAAVLKRPLVVYAFAALALIAAAGGTWLYARLFFPTTSTFVGIDVTGQLPVNFNLRDTAGKARTLADFKGKPLVVYFGFLNCPDACPTFLSKMREVRSKLGTDHQFNVALVTVDPERDTPETLRVFLNAFDPAFVGLIPTRDQLPSLLAQFKAFAQSNPPNNAGYYTVDHTTYAFVFDGKGSLRLIMPHDLSVQGWLSDLGKLLHSTVAAP